MPIMTSPAHIDPIEHEAEIHRRQVREEYLRQ
jgi:hypothetical protein